MERNKIKEYLQKKTKAFSYTIIVLGILFMTAALKTFSQGMNVLNLMLQVPAEYWNNKFTFLANWLIIGTIIITLGLSYLAIIYIMKGIKKIKEAQQ